MMYGIRQNLYPMTYFGNSLKFRKTCDACSINFVGIRSGLDTGLVDIEERGSLEFYRLKD